MDDAYDNTDRCNVFGRKERRMSVLVKGMEKPEHCGYCRFRYDGICHALQKTQYSMNECPLVVIDDAGLNDTISRQVAIDALKAMAVPRYKDLACEDIWERDRTLDRAIDVMHGLPSADAVQVVRCKDCVCWDTSWKPTRAIEGAYWCSNNDIYTESDDYCSLGERKES